MDPATQKQSKNCFLIMVNGQIETAEFFSVPNVYCKYCFVYGPDWKQVAGPEEGITQTGQSREGGRNYIPLNTPIDATFSSTNPFKWPQIVLSFYGKDMFGNDVVRGYSATHLPTVPGSSKRRCPISLPQAASTMQQMIGLFTGRRAEFVDSRIMAMAEGRDVIRVITHGFVELSFTTMFRDAKKFGYDLNPQMITRISEFPLDWPSNSSTRSNIMQENVAKKRVKETLQEIVEEEITPMEQEQSHTSENN